MLGRNNSETNSRTYALAVDQSYYSPKNYVTYAPIGSTVPAMPIKRDLLKQTDHMALYSVNPQLNSNGKPISNSNPSTINRNPYLNATTGQPRKDPPKHTISRNSSYKQTLVSRQSQQLQRSKPEFSKLAHKNSVSGSKQCSSQQGDHLTDTYSNLGLPPYSQTIDLGHGSKTQSIQTTVAYSAEEEMLKQKVEYLQVLEQSFKQFEKYQAIDILRNLNENNRLFLIKHFQQIRRVKEQRRRESLNDCISQSDNISEDAYSLDDRFQSRKDSVKVQAQRYKNIDLNAKAKDTSEEKQSEIAAQLRINKKLERQYEEEQKRLGKKDNSELERLQKSIKSLDIQINRVNSKNNEVAKKLNSLPFYQQWMLMCSEAEGAKKTAVKLKDQLKKRKDKLKEERENGAHKNSTQKSKPVGLPFDKNNQLDEDVQSRQGSQSKRRLPTIKFQATPTNRSQTNSIHESTKNGQLPEGSSRPIGNNQFRANSINRQNSNK